MNANLDRLAERRDRLVAQAAAQRRALGQDLSRWRRPLALADQGVNALRYIRSHPEWLVGIVMLLAVLRPRRVGKWLGSGLVSWRLMHKLRGS